MAERYDIVVIGAGQAGLSASYFVGLHWLHKRKSSLLMGVGEDAEYVVDHLTGL